MMQITDLAKEQNIPPILRLGFRPFFLLGAAFAVISIALWLAIFQGKLSIAPFGNSLWWHLHEMIFGFAGAIIAGFLLTAVQNWTGTRGVCGKPLLLLILLWLSGRLALLFPHFFSTQYQYLISLIDLVFFPATAYILARPILAVKQYRNLFFIPLLLLFTLVNLQMHLAIDPSNDININFVAYSGIILIVLLMSVIAGRVTPMFTANGTKTDKVINIKWLEILANGSLFILFLLFFARPILAINNQVFGLLFFVAGILQMVRTLRWKPWITKNVPLLWSLHGAIICLWTGLLMLGASYYFQTFTANHIWHLLTIGGIAGLILAMIARVSLGHTGRPLTVGRIMKLAFIALFISAIVRSILPLLFPEHTLNFYQLAALFWYGAFGLFLYDYAPKLLSARKDGRPG